MFLILQKAITLLPNIKDMQSATSYQHQVHSPGVKINILYKDHYEDIMFSMDLTFFNAFCCVVTFFRFNIFVKHR